MRDGLVLSDRAAEDDAFFRVADRFGNRGAADSDRFGGDQDALGIQAVEQAMKAAAFAADQIRRRHFQVVDEQQVGIDGGAAEFLELANFDRRRIELGEEQAHAVGFLADLLEGRGAREQEHPSWLRAPWW